MNESHYYLTGEQVARLLELGHFAEEEPTEEFCALLKTIAGQRLVASAGFIMMKAPLPYPGEAIQGAKDAFGTIGTQWPAAIGPQSLNLQYQSSCHHGGEHTWDFRQRVSDGAAERYCVKCGAVSAL